MSAEALPLCLDDKATENASGSQLHAFVEVKVINTKLRYFCAQFLMIFQGGRQKSGGDGSVEKHQLVRISNLFCLDFILTRPLSLFQKFSPEWNEQLEEINLEKENKEVKSKKRESF